MAESISKKSFYIFGYPIAKSKSPLLHGTGFQYHNLPHTFQIIETEKLDNGEVDIIQLIRSPSFGGAAVTMPFKIDIMKYLDEVTPTAVTVGAVNTIIPKEGKLIGDNTDWVGILRLVKKLLKQSMGLNPESTGCVLGAGGAGRAAIYALHALGLKTIYLRNRTRSKAQEVIDSLPSDFNVSIVDSLDASVFKDGPPIVIVGTIPSKGISLLPSPDTIYMDPALLGHTSGGVVIDMAYLPRRTPLVQLAESSPSWAIGTGIEVLLEQGYAQFKIWNALDAPQELIHEAVMGVYNKEADGK